MPAISPCWRTRGLEAVRGSFSQGISIGLQLFGEGRELLPIGPDFRLGIGDAFKAVFREERQHRPARMTCNDAGAFRHNEGVVGHGALHHRCQFRDGVAHCRHSVHSVQDDARRPRMCQCHCRDGGSGKRDRARPLRFHLPDCPWFLVVDHWLRPAGQAGRSLGRILSQAEKGSNLSQSFKPARLVIEQSFGPTVRSGFAGEEV